MSEPGGGRTGKGTGGSVRTAPRTGRPAGARPAGTGAPDAKKPRRRLVVTWGGAKGRPNRLTGRAGILALVLCTLAIALVVPVKQYLNQRQERVDLREQTKKHEQEVARLQAEIERWKDPAYVRQQARKDLHYVNPGDTQYSVVPPPSATPSPGASGGPKGSMPSQLWDSVKSADATPPAKTAPTGPPPAPAESIGDSRSSRR
ncbi:hypothetical protein GCM10023205_28740 [Yinghuangia aomiensis]|uniref:Cell division protein FtsB n=1 Tax=Yinghuangia aomiensis TaxID=676205 RepID=A0ABP9H7M8_9ACTN